MVSVQIIYFLSMQFGLSLSKFSILVSHPNYAELSEYHVFSYSQEYSQREGDQVSTEMIGKVLIFISKETDICCWLLLNQTGNAEQAMTGIFSFDFSFCHLTAHCFHSALKGQIDFLKAVN